MPGINEATKNEESKSAVAADGIVETTTVEPEETPEAAKPEAEKPAKKSKAKKKTEEVEPEKPELTRPPLEQLTRDFEAVLTSHAIGDEKVVKLGYKCGKILYGLKRSTKDFRLIAFKARKKTKSVNGKSRCIFYFGVDQATAKTLAKTHPEVSISKFGKCAVQSQTPVELVLDRTTFTEKFEKNSDKVIELLTSLAATTVENKTEIHKAATEKIAAKEKKAADAKAKTEAKVKEKASRKSKAKTETADAE